MMNTATTAAEMVTFGMNGASYQTDAETLAVLRSIVPAAKRTGDTSAVQAVIELGIETGRIVKVLHVFERAGLGQAPFRIVGVSEKRGPITIAGGLTVGAPGQPMGSCDFCGTGIAECWHVQSADGKTFIVGCDCVLKSGDAGMRKVVKEHEAAKRRAAADRKRERDGARIAAAAARLSEVEAAWRAEAHPQAETNEWIRKQGLTRFDWATWMLKNAGTTGRLAVAKAIEQALAQ